MAIERDADDVARCFLLERELFERGWRRSSTGEVTGVIGAGAFVAFGDGHEGLLPGAPAARRLVGAQRARDDPGRRAERAAIRLGDPVRVRVERVDAPRGRVDLSPVRVVRPARCAGTSRRTGRPRSATSCSKAGGGHGAARHRGQVAARRQAQLKDGYAAVSDGELWLHNVHIPPYAPAARENHEPERPRKLLLHKREIERLIGKTREKGLTLVPTRIYFKGAHAKVEIALARGKDVGDKRQTIKEREMKREMERAVRRR